MSPTSPRAALPGRMGSALPTALHGSVAAEAQDDFERTRLGRAYRQALGAGVVLPLHSDGTLDRDRAETGGYEYFRRCVDGRIGRELQRVAARRGVIAHQRQHALGAA